MKPLSLLFALAALSIVFSCRKPDDPPPSPCVDITVDKSPLNLKWSTLGPPNNSVDNFAKTFPIVWNAKVLCAGKFGDQMRIVCYNGATGSRIWEVPVEGFITNAQLKLSGDKLYWANDRTLWSLDLNTATAAKVCEFEEGFLNRNFAIWNDLAFCFLTDCFTCDTVIGATYLVDIQTGVFQDVYREVKYPSLNQYDFLQDPVISTNSDGDTLFCFMESDRFVSFDGYLNRFVCLNLTQGTTVYSASVISQFSYYEEGNLSIHDGKAYVPIVDTIYCFSTENGATLWKQSMGQATLTVKEGHLFASPYGYHIFNLDLEDGHIIWKSDFIAFGISPFQSTLVRNGHFYFIGEAALCAIDLINGCLLSKRYVPATLPDYGYLGNGLALSNDGKTIYLRDYPNLVAAEFSD